MLISTKISHYDMAETLSKKKLNSKKIINKGGFCSHLRMTRRMKIYGFLVGFIYSV